MTTTDSHLDWFSGAAAAATGMGILTFTFFPFALPLLLLTAAAALVLALPVIALAAVAGILTGTWHLVRAAGRGARRLGRGVARTRVMRQRLT